MKKNIFSLTIILLFAIGLQAQKAAVYSKNGKAIDGYDPVAFFTDSIAVKGADSLAFTWNEAAWHFANKENLEKFKADPNHFTPQYGGYCAFGASDGEGHKAPTQVDTWTIVNNKLYFNYNKKVKELWTKQQGELIKKADSNWPTLKDKE